MSNNSTQVLHDASLLLQQGKGEEALALLDQMTLPQVSTEAEHESGPTLEVLYLRVWAFASCDRWENAAELLLAGVPEASTDQDLKRTLGGTDRRRKAPVTFLLGAMASQLGQDAQAAVHYRNCLVFLDERRMNIPGLRIATLCRLASASSRQGLHASAASHYQEALHLIGNDDHPHRLAIVQGLCEAYLALKDREQAALWGEQSLQYARDHANLLGEIRALFCLGKVSQDPSVAVPYYEQAMAGAIALPQEVQGETLVPILVAKAAFHARQGEYELARRHCNQVLSFHDSLADPSVRGSLCHIMGDCLIGHAQTMSGDLQPILQEAFTWYDRAASLFKEALLSRELSETYERLAQLSERRGDDKAAIEYWKEAFAAAHEQ